MMKQKDEWTTTTTLTRLGEGGDRLAREEFDKGFKGQVPNCSVMVHW